MNRRTPAALLILCLFFLVAGQRAGNISPVSAQSVADQSVVGQPAPAHKAPKAKPLRPGDLDPRTSRVYILVGKTGLGHDHGIEGKIRSGRLKVGAAEKAGTLEFDLRSFVADTAAARAYVGLEGRTDQGTADKVTRNMLSNAVLDVAHFPTARFDATSISRLRSRDGEPEQYQIDGEFTLHGRKNPIRFKAQADEADGFIHLRGAFAIRQTDYGITPYSQAFGAVGVADQLTIYGDLYLVAGEVDDAETTTAEAEPAPPPKPARRRR